MRFVDYGEIEGRGGAQKGGAAFAACEFPANQIHSRCYEIRVIFSGLDAKEVEQLALPLSEQGFGNNQQDAPGAFSAALGNDQAGLNRFPSGRPHPRGCNRLREDAGAQR